MARIDFAFGATDRLRAACDAASKHYRKGGRLVVYCTDQALLDRFDVMLWGFEATAFVPHVLANDPLAQQTAVWLSSEPLIPAADSDPLPWLLNLDEQCAPGLEHYARVLEVVAQDDAALRAGRNRWRQYKTQGHDLHAHDLSRAPTHRNDNRDET